MYVVRRAYVGKIGVFHAVQVVRRIFKKMCGGGVRTACNEVLQYDHAVAVRVAQGEGVVAGDVDFADEPASEKRESFFLRLWSPTFHFIIGSLP